MRIIIEINECSDQKVSPIVKGTKIIDPSDVSVTALDSSFEDVDAGNSIEYIEQQDNAELKEMENEELEIEEAGEAPTLES